MSKTQRTIAVAVAVIVSCWPHLGQASDAFVAKVRGTSITIDKGAEKRRPGTGLCLQCRTRCCTGRLCGHRGRLGGPIWVVANNASAHISGHLPTGRRPLDHDVHRGQFERSRRSPDASVGPPDRRNLNQAQHPDDERSRQRSSVRAPAVVGASPVAELAFPGPLAAAMLFLYFLSNRSFL
jgi:hypothetical protein